MASQAHLQYVFRREYNRRVKEVVETSWMEEPDADDS
jgi:hypothetical protein